MSFLLYLGRRLLSGLLTVLVVATLCFVVLHALPGDPTDAILGETATEQDRTDLRKRLRLDQPVLKQYGAFILDIVVPWRGMGHSLREEKRTVLNVVGEVWPSTLRLALAATAFAWLLAIPLAMIAASRPGTRTDAAVGVFSMIGLVIPSLWLGPLLILTFCVFLPWFPFPGPDATSASALVLPAFSLGLGMAGILTRMGRASLRETQRAQFVTAARARGLSESTVMFKHTLRASMIPLLTTGGSQLTSLMGGAIITEKVFDRRGLGTTLLQALGTRDLPVVLGCVVVIAATGVLIQLLVDIAYVLVDPRIRLGATS